MKMTHDMPRGIGLDADRGAMGGGGGVNATRSKGKDIHFQPSAQESG